MFRITLTILLTVLLSQLTGCSTGSGFEDLEAYVKEVKARPKKRIEPLPEFKAYEAFSYSAANRRSPFTAPQTIQLASLEQQPKSNVKPDFNRPQELLESFAIGSMAMVGTIVKQDESTLYGLVSDGEGGIHRVRVGNYMGKNHGKVVKVTESQIELIEIVSDGQGGWFERPRTMGLKEVN
ncbi:pilus assembly protein PilP [Hahella sp. CCB-MM4]|uniref:pilus assembly protein PilP n=1 Tax=Hahella sp. (strain CCB-MM4) TaxID=1926491 RepID=UPI000B9B11D3|nr:pilus assembly protein PilP [Hahella sp. CCB-MM4]OZG71437.1 pilus assembly protein PilP [Hahella sp. CCB-MM4]